MANESSVAERSFYRYSKYVWSAARAVFGDFQKELVKECLALTNGLVVSFDMGWQKRHGFCSSLGMLNSTLFIFDLIL